MLTFNDILYCKKCLKYLISINNNLCPIRNHQNPVYIEYYEIKDEIDNLIAKCNKCNIWKNKFKFYNKHLKQCNQSYKLQGKKKNYPNFGKCFFFEFNEFVKNIFFCTCTLTL